MNVGPGGNKSDSYIIKIKNIPKFFKLWDEVIKLYNDCFKMVHEAANSAKHGKRFKILTLKQMLPRLPLAFAKVKASSTSGNLLNEIC